eukprot:scpid34174/ scgid12906/ Latent-transforming growth factor beta-binding protein 1; Transforming growth factor beta-1-binding protein 1
MTPSPGPIWLGVAPSVRGSVLLLALAFAACVSSQEEPCPTQPPVGPCPAGFLKNPGTEQCEDIDECQPGTAPESALSVCSMSTGPCRNTHGSYYCDCTAGYERTVNGTCRDTPECLRYPNICRPGGACIDYPGGFRCNCSSGYMLTADQMSCSDFDECSETVSPSSCFSHEICLNSMGSFVCHAPQRVFLGTSPPSGETTCTDVSLMNIIVYVLSGVSALLVVALAYMTYTKWKLVDAFKGTSRRNLNLFGTPVTYNDGDGDADVDIRLANGQVVNVPYDQLVTFSLNEAPSTGVERHSSKRKRNRSASGVGVSKQSNSVQPSSSDLKSFARRRRSRASRMSAKSECSDSGDVTDVDENTLNTDPNEIRRWSQLSSIQRSMRCEWQTMESTVDNIPAGTVQSSTLDFTKDAAGRSSQHDFYEDVQLRRQVKICELCFNDYEVLRKIENGLAHCLHNVSSATSLYALVKPPTSTRSISDGRQSHDMTPATQVSTEAVTSARHLTLDEDMSTVDISDAFPLTTRRCSYPVPPMPDIVIDRSRPSKCVRKRSQSDVIMLTAAESGGPEICMAKVNAAIDAELNLWGSDIPPASPPVLRSTHSLLTDWVESPAASGGDGGVEDEKTSRMSTSSQQGRRLLFSRTSNKPLSSESFSVSSYTSSNNGLQRTLSKRHILKRLFSVRSSKSMMDINPVGRLPSGVDESASISATTSPPQLDTQSLDGALTEPPLSTAMDLSATDLAKMNPLVLNSVTSLKQKSLFFDSTGAMFSATAGLPPSQPMLEVFNNKNREQDTGGVTANSATSSVALDRPSNLNMSGGKVQGTSPSARLHGRTAGFGGGGRDDHRTASCVSSTAQSPDTQASSTTVSPFSGLGRSPGVSFSANTSRDFLIGDRRIAAGGGSGGSDELSLDGEYVECEPAGYGQQQQQPSVTGNRSQSDEQGQEGEYTSAYVLNESLRGQHVQTRGLMSSAASTSDAWNTDRKASHPADSRTASQSGLLSCPRPRSTEYDYCRVMLPKKNGPRRRDASTVEGSLGGAAGANRQPGSLLRSASVTQLGTDSIGRASTLSYLDLLCSKIGDGGSISAAKRGQRVVSADDSHISLTNNKESDGNLAWLSERPRTVRLPSPPGENSPLRNMSNSHTVTYSLCGQLPSPLTNSSAALSVNPLLPRSASASGELQADTGSKSSSSSNSIDPHRCASLSSIPPQSSQAQQQRKAALPANMPSVHVQPSSSNTVVMSSIRSPLLLKNISSVSSTSSDTSSVHSDMTALSTDLGAPYHLPSGHLSDSGTDGYRTEEDTLATPRSPMPLSSSSGQHAATPSDAAQRPTNSTSSHLAAAGGGKGMHRARSDDYEHIVHKLLPASNAHGGGSSGGGMPSFLHTGNEESSDPGFRPRTYSSRKTSAFPPRPVFIQQDWKQQQPQQQAPEQQHSVAYSRVHSTSTVNGSTSTLKPSESQYSTDSPPLMTVHLREDSLESCEAVLTAVKPNVFRVRSIDFLAQQGESDVYSNLPGSTGASNGIDTGTQSSTTITPTSQQLCVAPSPVSSRRGSSSTLDIGLRGMKSDSLTSSCSAERYRMVYAREDGAQRLATAAILDSPCLRHQAPPAQDNQDNVYGTVFTVPAGKAPALTMALRRQSQSPSAFPVVAAGSSPATHPPATGVQERFIAGVHNTNTNAPNSLAPLLEQQHLRLALLTPREARDSTTEDDAYGQESGEEDEPDSVLSTPPELDETQLAPTSYLTPLDLLSGQVRLTGSHKMMRFVTSIPDKSDLLRLMHAEEQLESSPPGDAVELESCADYIYYPFDTVQVSDKSKYIETSHIRHVSPMSRCPSSDRLSTASGLSSYSCKRARDGIQEIDELDDVIEYHL